MSKTGARSILDLFLLAVLSDGVMVNPYDLASHLGISPGASIPALRRLLKQGLIEKKEVGMRGRQAFDVTAKGKNVLKQEIQDALQDSVERTPLDAESIARIGALGLGSHTVRGLSTRIIKAALAKSGDRAVSAEEKLKSLQQGARRTTGEIYNWAMATMEVAHWKAQTKAVRQVYSHLTTTGYRQDKGQNA